MFSPICGRTRMKAGWIAAPVVVWLLASVMGGTFDREVPARYAICPRVERPAPDSQAEKRLISRADAEGA
jgi:hypothetical protein